MHIIVDGETSNHTPVTSGVPQGIVLAPLLFLLHINDMLDVMREGTKLESYTEKLDLRVTRVSYIKIYTAFNIVPRDRLFILTLLNTMI